MNIMGLLDRPTKGTYSLDGQDVTRLGDNAASGIRNRTVGFVFQLFHLLPRISVLENVLLPVLYARPYPGGAKERALKLLDAVGLSNRASYRPDALSGGQQQRVALARALANEPQLLLADEPTGNLDSKAAADILDLLDGIHRKGCTIVLVTHDAAIAARAQRVVTLRDGGIVADERRR